MEFTDEQRSALGWQLEILGFPNTGEILSTAKELSDDIAVETENISRLTLTAQSGPDDARFVFLAFKAANERWKISSIKTYKSYEIDPSRKEVKEYIVESEMTMLLDKKHMLEKVESAFLLDKTKIALLENNDLRNQLSGLGFTDYEYLVANTVAWFDRPVLSAKLKLPEHIGIGNDEMQFNIWLGTIRDKEPQKINCIYATYESSIKVISDPDFTGSQVFTALKGEFPTAQEMTNTVLNRYRDWFLGAAKAFQVRENIQKGSRNRGRKKGNNL